MGLMSKRTRPRTGVEAKRRRARIRRRLARAAEIRAVDHVMLAALNLAMATELNTTPEERAGGLANKITVPPGLERFARLNFPGVPIIVDPTMPKNRIAIVPIAYAHHIPMTIGLAPKPN